MSRTAESPRQPRICFSHLDRSATGMSGRRARRTMSRSPAMATSTGTFFPSSLASMSMWIFFAWGAYSLSLPVTRSSKRMPKASSRSASWMALLTQASPCMPIMPRLRGWVAGTAPRPRRVSA